MLHVEGPVRDPSEETVRTPPGWGESYLLAQWPSSSTSGWEVVGGRRLPRVHGARSEVG